MLSVTETIEDLENKGYRANLKVTGEGLFKDSKQLPLNQSQIDEVRRVESDSDPSHQTVIFAISCAKPSIKGIVVSSYGPSSDSDKIRVLQQIEENSSKSKTGR